LVGRLGAFAARGFSLRSLFALLTGAVLALLPLFCGPTGTGIALLPHTPSSAHDAYAHTLAKLRLAWNPEAREWIAASERALLAPVPTKLPFTESGRFTATDDFTRGHRFTVRGGQRVQVDVTFNSTEPRELFVDLFRASAGRFERVVGRWPTTPGGPSDTRPIELEVLEAGDFVLRVQPELGAAGDYAVSIAAAPLLSFPVQGLDVGAIQSGFGAERDGGRRAHRGVDIFAPRGTTALAAIDAWVLRVETTRVGGNVVWLQPLFGNLRLYYAHLDTQLVERGQFVHAGDPIGTVGNTGNARTTPPHLHFGVYVRRPGVRGGAQDPYAFLH
jgi:peptidoglycan LD-endopeptidase LytH